jgi:hypothetical protein
MQTLIFRTEIAATDNDVFVCLKHNAAENEAPSRRSELAFLSLADEPGDDDDELRHVEGLGQMSLIA